MTYHNTKMKLLNKIFNKKGASDRKSQPSSPDVRQATVFNCTTTAMSPIATAKVLRLLGAENKDQENQIMEMVTEPPADSTDVSFEDDDSFEPNTNLRPPTPPGFTIEHRRSLDSCAPPRCSSDTDTFDPCESRSMSYESRSVSPSPSSPFCRSPQHSPRTRRELNTNNNTREYNTNSRDTARAAHPLPVPNRLRDRLKNDLTVATARPLPLPQAVACRLETRNQDTIRLSPLPSPASSPRALDANNVRFSPLPSPTSSPYSRSFAPRSPQHSPQRSPSRPLNYKYKIIQEIGRGSFATVYEGFLDDGSFCAIKVIHDSTMTEDTTKEVALLSQLKHPNIVRYLGACMDENRSLCIFLELMKCSLKFVLNKLGGFEESTIRSYTRQILYGLEYLHEQNTIHRDIKCANILVDSQGQVKLADFGVAKQTPLASSLKGTPVFMAPEIMTPNPARRSYGTAVDIWSLGCTVLEMYNGQPPWGDLGFGFYFKLSKGETPPIPDNLNSVARDFIQRCLKVNPEERPKAYELLQHKFVVDAPSSVPPLPSPLISPRASPMHRHATPRNVIQETQFHPIEGLRRNGNLNMITREDSGFTAGPAATWRESLSSRVLGYR